MSISQETLKIHFHSLWESSNWRGRTEVWLTEQTLQPDCVGSESKLTHPPTHWLRGIYLPSWDRMHYNTHKYRLPLFWGNIFTFPPHWYQAWQEIHFGNEMLSKRNMCNFGAETCRARTKSATIIFLTVISIVWERGWPGSWSEAALKASRRHSTDSCWVKKYTTAFTTQYNSGLLVAHWLSRLMCSLCLDVLHLPLGLL